MKVTIWGCRGSMPSPGPDMIKYGGNTSCVQVEQDDTCLILDGGSGIQELGNALDPEIRTVNILLSHLHIDHIMGLGYFKPFYNPKCTVNIWGPTGSNESLVHRLRRYFSPPFFPVRLKELLAEINIYEIDNSEFEIDEFRIRSEYICHPGPTVGYRIESGNSVLSYIPDHEPALGSSDFPNSGEWCSGFNIANKADLLLHDGQYDLEDYVNKIGWGHSAMQDAIDFGKLSQVKKLALFHHDPLHSDETLEKIFEKSTRDKDFEFELSLAREKDVFVLE
jgi:phosphoribosyl 1,2-cyclic phosphodiesterase